MQSPQAVVDQRQTLLSLAVIKCDVMPMYSPTPQSDPDGRAQEALLRGLMNPRSYPHEVAAIERIETHISTVLLTGRYAYKIKKPVDLGFLDFTSLAARRHFCEEELRLNRRLAPGLYLDVVAICGTPDAPRVSSGEAQDAIEYAVKMKQFPQSGLLDHMLTRGELTPSQVDALARIVAAFHAAAARAGGEDPYGAPASVEGQMRQNFTQIRSLPALTGAGIKIDELERWSLAQHTALTPLMAQRKSEGFVRECHGDLHLGNIALADGEIQIFDCIEFNPDLSWTDVAAEIGFLLMDFAARARPDLGARFLNAYLEISGDYACVRLLPYYLVYRALVRAKVAGIRSHQPGITASQCAAALTEFAAHLDLAHAFTRKPQPCLMITRGVSGSGKTTVTQPLVEHTGKLGALRLRSDIERKRLYGLPGAARSHSAVDAGLYTEDASRQTYDELYCLARLLIEAGWPVIVDASFLQRSQRNHLRALADEMRAPFLVLDCHAEADELRRRVAQREAAGSDASEATLAVLERQLETAEPVAADERGYTLSIDTQHDDLRQFSRQVCVRLGLAVRE